MWCIIRYNLYKGIFINFIPYSCVQNLNNEKLEKLFFQNELSKRTANVRVKIAFWFQPIRSVIDKIRRSDWFTKTYFFNSGELRPSA